MGTFSTLTALATAFQVILTVGALVIGACIVLLVASWVAEHRPQRLAAHQSIPAYYLHRRPVNARSHA